MAGCQTLPVSGIDVIPAIIAGVVLVISGLAATALARRRGWRRLVLSIGGIAVIVSVSVMVTSMARAADAGTCVGGGAPSPAPTSTPPISIVSPDPAVTTTVIVVTTPPTGATTTSLASTTTAPKGPPPVVPEAPAVVLLGISALSVAGIAGLGMRRRTRRMQD